MNQTRHHESTLAWPNQAVVRRRAEEGSALIAVFWLMAVLGLAVFTTLKISSADLGLLSTQEDVFRARLAAEMGVNIACNSRVEKTDYSLLRRTFDDGYASFEAKIVGEDGKMNLNTVLLGDDPNQLRTFFENWGLDESFAMALVDSAKDWVDADDLAEFDGAEEEDYEELGFPDYPFNRQFYSLDEFLLVRGMAVIPIIRPNWRENFTIWTTGQVDINEAPMDVVQAVANVTFENADEFIQERQRRRAEAEAQDPPSEEWRYQDIGEVAAALGIGGEAELQQLQSRITFTSQTETIDCVGRAGDIRVRIVMVVRNRTNQPTILSREEPPIT